MTKLNTQHLDSNNAKNVSLVVAALNEEKLIESTVHSIVESAEGHLTDYELILVNDGSKDNTGNIMEKLASANSKITVLHNQTTLGLGGIFQRALTVAKLNYFMLLCGDGGLPGESLPAIFDKVGATDIVIPHMNNLKEIKSSGRYMLSMVYTNLLNIVFNQKLKYYNGLPVYRLDLLRQIKIASRGFGFQAEILTKLLKAGATYAQVEVQGAEKSNRSIAFNAKSLLCVTNTLLGLIWEIFLFKPKTINKA